MSQPMDRRSFVAGLASAVVALGASRARATTLARVAITSPEGSVDARDVLHEAMRDELGRNTSIELVEASRAVFMLNASVRREGTGCVVSVLVEERRSGRLRAILQGSARAPSSEDVETSALVRVAVRSALRSLGRALA